MSRARKDCETKHEIRNTDTSHGTCELCKCVNESIPPRDAPLKCIRQADNGIHVSARDQSEGENQSNESGTGCQALASDASPTLPPDSDRAMVPAPTIAIRRNSVATNSEAARRPRLCVLRLHTLGDESNGEGRIIFGFRSGPSVPHFRSSDEMPNVALRLPRHRLN